MYIYIYVSRLHPSSIPAGGRRIFGGIPSVLQGVAVCCSVLQCVAVCCSVVQCVAVCNLHPSFIPVFMHVYLYIDIYIYIYIYTAYKSMYICM